MSIHWGGRGHGHISRFMGNAFSPLSLFTSGEQGAWYDPSDFSTMFQDSAGTTPVTSLGQSVGRILDKSGRNNHATQSGLNTLKPTLQQDSNGKYFLLFDGSDDFLITPTITPGIDKVQVFTGLRKLSDAASGVVLETSTTTGLNAGAIAMFAPAAGGADKFAFETRGSASPVRVKTTSTTYNAPVTSVISAFGDIAAPSALIKINATQIDVNTTTTQGGGNYLAYPLYIGRRAGTSLPFNGRIYGMIVRFGANLSASVIQQTETWMNSKTGAY